MRLTYAVDTADVPPDVTGPADLPGLRTARPEYWRHPGQDGLSSVGSLRGSRSSPVVISPVLSLNTSSMSHPLLLLLLLVRDAEIPHSSDEFSLRVRTVRGQRAAGDAGQT